MPRLIEPEPVFPPPPETDWDELITGKSKKNRADEDYAIHLIMLATGCCLGVMLPFWLGIIVLPH
jgi:hypothetical protein